MKTNKTIKFLVLFVTILIGTYLFVNFTIGKNEFQNLKSILTFEQKKFIKKFFFPYKLIDQQNISILQKDLYISKQHKLIYENIDLIKTDGEYTFNLSENNNLYFYSNSKRQISFKITGVLKDKYVTCFEASYNQSHIVNLNLMTNECKESVFFIGYLDNRYFYFRLKQSKKKNTRNLLVLPASNFYNYSSNYLDINQYTSKIDYYANLNEVPLNDIMQWAEKTSLSVHNLSKFLNDFDVILDYEFPNIDLNGYELVILPLHQEYVSKEFLEKMINFLKIQNKAVLSIGGANFMRQVKFKKNRIVYVKDALVDKKYHLNTLIPRKYKDCIYIKDEDLILGEITHPEIFSNIEYFYFDIKCKNNVRLPLISIQSFDYKQNSRLIHVTSDGIGINFNNIENVRTKIDNTLKNIFKN